MRIQLHGAFCPDLREASHSGIDGIVSAWTLRHEVEEIEQKLLEAEVPASRIFTIADVFSDPHYRARNMLVDVPDDDWSSVTLAGPVPKLSKTPAHILRSGGRIGQDTKRVLTDLAGMSDTEIEQLDADKVIYCDRPDSE